MSMTSDAIGKNVEAFCKPLTDQEMNQLSSYLCNGFMNNKPTPLQQEFIDEFFGKLEWAEFLSEAHKPNTFFSSSAFVNTRALLNTVREYILFEEHWKFKQLLDIESSNSILGEALRKSVKLELEKKLLESKVKLLEKKTELLKASLKRAISDSYDFDNVFDKIEGFCNIIDVLEVHELIDIPETTEEIKAEEIKELEERLRKLKGE